MNFWNLSVKRGVDGSKHLDVQIHGVIDGGWLDENPVSTAEVIAELQQHLDAKTIGVRINSIGGSAFGGIALYNALESHPAEVTSTIEGLAASAASLVAMAGKTVMGRGAMMMIHPPLTMAMGNAAELRRTADVLDKVQTGLASIYTAKTGLGIADVNDLINGETWMTADEAVAAGFANEVGGTLPVPAAAEPSEGDEDEKKKREDGYEDRPQMAAQAVIWNGVSFPVAKLPQQILAMARPSAQHADEPAAEPSAPSNEPEAAPDPEKQKPDPAPAEEETAPETPAAKTAKVFYSAADILNAEKRGHDRGVAEERARLEAIDKLPVRGHVALVADAKYGDEPKTAGQLAVLVLNAEQQAGADLIEARRNESMGAAGVRQSAPQHVDAASKSAEEERLVRLIVGKDNKSPGGDR